jgi:hypothetical protein
VRGEENDDPFRRIRFKNKLFWAKNQFILLQFFEKGGKERLKSAFLVGGKEGRRESTSFGFFTRFEGGDWRARKGRGKREKDKKRERMRR